MAKNKLVVVGCIGIRRAYLNVPRDEAVQRYLESEKQDKLHDCDHVNEFEFDDEFGTYDSFERFGDVS